MKSKLFNKFVSLALVFALILPMFIPAFSVKAANPYSVVMVANSSNNKTVGTYATYSEAVKAMNAQNSTSTSVASVYKDGKIINSRYAIFQFKPNGSTINLYQGAGSNAYTYVRPSSMTDAAFIDSTEQYALIMHEGFKGYVDISMGNIIPISLLGSNAVNITASGLRLRSSTSTSASVLASITCTNAVFTYTEKTTSGGYTWYKINYNGTTGFVASGSWLTETSGTSLDTYYYRYSTGNLLHRYAYHNGSSYTDYFTNLGPTPTYLTEGVHYYSFDGGIYLYTTLTSMLDDYRNDTYTRSLNANNPNYPYYLFLPSKSVSKVSAAELDSQITNTSSKLYGQGKYFKEAESLYGMNALTAFAKARAESANGLSKIALDKNNVFGYGAYDSCAYDCAKSYSSVRDSIMDYAQKSLGSYATAEAVYYFGSNPGTKGSGRNVKYASDPVAGEKEAASAFSADLKNNSLRDYKSNTIGVTKYGKYNVPVYKDASTSSVIYYLRNKNSALKVYNVPVNVVERVGDFYKIYSEKDGYQYGYVKVSDFNLTNKEPVISASDKTIALNSSFNYKDGVSATDAENGNLTSRITYNESVNTSKVGTYSVTYTVTDDSNLKVSKTINVTVKGSSEPVINASDKEVSQYTSFDYMDGVSALDDTDGDITSLITYDKSVDTDVKGTYDVTYTVTNSNGKTISKTIKVTVVDNEKPVISASDKTVYLNQEFDALSLVTASDKEDGNLSDKVTVVSENVNTSVIGEYEVTYSVTDSANQTSTKTIKVIVTEKVLKETEGEFYLDSIDWNSSEGKYDISGYLIQLGVDNGKEDKISFELILKDDNTGDEYIMNIDRWTEDEPFDLGEENGHDYNGAWFKGSIDLSSIPSGDYSLYMRSTSDDYYSETIFSNLLNSSIDRRGVFDERGYSLKVDLTNKNKPINLSVRDSGLIIDNDPPTYRNMVNDYDDIYFEGNKMFVKGISYDYGVEYSSSSDIERKVILENTKTFEQFSFDVGSTDNGSYTVTTLDNLSKKYSWYYNSFDVSDLPKGTYSIIVYTKVKSVADYGNMVDIFNAINEAKTSINDKNYEVKVNTGKNNRIELNIT